MVGVHFLAFLVHLHNSGFDESFVIPILRVYFVETPIFVSVFVEKLFVENVILWILVEQHVFNEVVAVVRVVEFFVFIHFADLEFVKFKRIVEVDSVGVSAAHRVSDIVDRALAVRSAEVLAHAVFGESLSVVV